MKRYLFFLVLVSNINCTPVTVYVCDSKNATKYHYKANCRGLADCQYHIIKQTLDDARKKNKKPCEWERSKDKP